MYCKDCWSFGVCRYASGSRLLEKEPCKYLDRIFIPRNKEAERALKERESNEK